ncbi:MAG: selenium-binding protein SBP56-related protein [Gammaproteobacteria bacterium]
MILCLAGHGAPAVADETCQSPYMTPIKGQEEFVYVWTLGMDGVGDESDKLVTVDVRPGSETYGKVISSHSVGGQHEAHHSGLSDDRRTLWAGTLDDSQLYLFDIATDPAKPRLKKHITDFVEASGGATGPHTVFALPGRVLITATSNNRDHGGRSALVEYTNEGEYIATYWIPTPDNMQGASGKEFADGYNYDVRVLPRKNVMLTSSWTGWSNYMRDGSEVTQDPEAMKRWGNSMTVWNLHTRQPLKVLQVPGAPLEVRWALGKDHNYAFTHASLTSKLWLIYEDEQGEWQAKDVLQVGDPANPTFPGSIVISEDDRYIWWQGIADGTTRLIDVSDPFHPKEVYQKKIGSQINMGGASWDGSRVYFTSSALSKWDRNDEQAEQFLRGYAWDGKELTQTFTVDFVAEGLGRAHMMLFGAHSLYSDVTTAQR